MSEMSSANWSTTDSGNTAAVPNGWPVGMAPNQVRPTDQSMMGALKRWWERINGIVTTTGSANAYIYTPSNTNFPTAYVAGEKFAWKANFANTGAATLNVNSLGGKSLFKPGVAGPVALTGGEIQIGQFVESMYDGTQMVITSALATAQPGLVFLSSQSASGSSRISFTGLTSLYDRHLIKMDSVLPATDNVFMLMEVSEDNGVTWQTTGSTYGWSVVGGTDGGAAVAGGSPTTANIPLVGANLPNTGYLSGDVELSQFMMAGLSLNHHVKFDMFHTPKSLTSARWVGSGRFYGDSNPLNAVSFRMSSGNVAAGKFSLYGYRNG